MSTDCKNTVTEVVSILLCSMVTSRFYCPIARRSTGSLPNCLILPSNCDAIDWEIYEGIKFSFGSISKPLKSPVEDSHLVCEQAYMLILATVLLLTGCQLCESCKTFRNVNSHSPLKEGMNLARACTGWGLGVWSRDLGQFSWPQSGPTNF